VKFQAKENLIIVLPAVKRPISAFFILIHSLVSVQSSAQTVHTVQTSVGRRTPLDRALTSTNPLLTDLSGKKMTEGPRVSYNQKQKNDDVYNSYLELQLSR